jgi:hypothetical protein
MLLPTQPNPTAERLRVDVKNVFEKIGKRPIVATIDTKMTPVAHGLRGTLVSYSVLPHADARVWQAADPDGRFIYLRASTSVVCSISTVED